MNKKTTTDKQSEQEKNQTTEQTEINIKEKLAFLKKPEWYIDNATLIILIVIVLILAAKGHFIDKQVIEVCNGMPTTLLKPTI